MGTTDWPWFLGGFIYGFGPRLSFLKFGVCMISTQIFSRRMEGRGFNAKQRGGEGGRI
jgi:hypothetical protein